MPEPVVVRVVAVVVAYNRRELLLETLDALRLQSRPVDGIVVVDNASTDGSGDAALASAVECDVVRLETNTGGAGGFAVGMARAMADHGAELLWVMDDDTVPTPTALDALLRAREGYRGDVALLASRVVWVDGLEHPMNTPRTHPFAGRAARERASEADAVLVRSASFVSLLVDATAVRRHGLPIAEYFIWNDDFEFSTRLLRRGTGLFVPASVVVHKTKQRVATDDDPGPRFYYEVRNKIWLFRFSSGLNLAEKLVYGGSSIRRWTRTMSRSSNRRTLFAAFRAGIRDGFRTRPRENRIVVAGAPTAVAVLDSYDAGVR